MNDTLQSLLPSILVLVSVCFSWITVIISGSVLKKLKHEVISWPKFKDIQLPKEYHLVLRYIYFVSNFYKSRTNIIFTYGIF